MKNKLFIIGAAVVGMFTVGACSDLESVTYDGLNSSIFPKTEEDVNTLIAAQVYEMYNCDWTGLNSVGGEGVAAISDMCTDIGDCLWGDQYWYDLIHVNFNLNQPSNVHKCYRKWTRSVATMTKLITTIKGLGSITEDKKNALLAQVYCGRGGLAYTIYDLWGPLQIASDEILANPQNNIFVKRVSAEESEKFIEDNLLEAVKYLPDRIEKTSGDYGRFTKGVAYTYLMRLYMLQGRWADAVKIGNEMMKPQYGYKLADSYKKLFTLEGEGDAEIIFCNPADPGNNANWWLAEVLPGSYPTKNTHIQKWNGYRLTWDFFDTFEAGDLRLETIGYDYIGTDDKHYCKDTPYNDLRIGPIPIKYGEDPADTGTSGSIDYICLRFADIVLLQAEALARNAGNVTADAIDQLNRVRNRAGLKSYSTSDFADLQAFLDAVLLERGHEGYFEGWRRTDLIRHGKFLDYARKYKKSVTADKRHLLFPIPQDIITEGRGQVVQNEGY